MAQISGRNIYGLDGGSARIDAKPIIKNLIVPVSELADAIKRSNEEGSAVAVAYDRISELTEAEIKKIMEGV